MEFDLTPLCISLKTAFAATIITFFLGIFIARWMVFSGGKRKSLIDGLIVMPMVLPPTVVGFILLIIFGKNGLLGQLLLKMGTIVVFSWPATVITATVVALPLMYRTARGAFEQIDPNIIDAARTLGVSDWYIFWRVILPVSFPGIGAGLILSFARALGEFGATLMLAGNIPGKTQTIPIAIFFAVESGDMKTAFLWAVIIILMSLTAVLVMNCWIKKQYRFNHGSRGI